MAPGNLHKFHAPSWLMSSWSNKPQDLSYYMTMTTLYLIVLSKNQRSNKTADYETTKPGDMTQHSLIHYTTLSLISHMMTHSLNK